MILRHYRATAGSPNTVPSEELSGPHRYASQPLDRASQQVSDSGPKIDRIMWKPPERIRHQLPEPKWPTQEEAAASRLFSPLEYGNLQMRSRTWIPAMVPWRATEDGYVTPEIIDWYERFAQGHPGGLVVEATGIRDVPSGPLLRIGHGRFLRGLRELANTVHSASEGRTRLFIQLIDFLKLHRRPEPETYFQRYLDITDDHRNRLEKHLDRELPEDDDVRQAFLGLDKDLRPEFLTARELESLEYGYRERVTDMDKEHIRTLPRYLPDLFADAAARARDAGFDGVELHFAHAYTMASFLSTLNDRDDNYGGSPRNRIRLALEILQRVRQKAGKDFVVGCRYLSEETIQGGSTVGDAMYYGVELSKAGMDFLSLSRGGKFDDAKQPKVGRAIYPYTGQSGYECMPTAISDAKGPFGRNVEPVARIMRAVRAAGYQTPLVLSGGIASFEQAEEILQRGDADIIGSARQSLADPDWYAKIRAGEGEAIRRCIFTNYCEGLDQMHKQVTCQLWDRFALNSPHTRRSKDGKRRLTAPEWEREDDDMLEFY